MVRQGKYQLPSLEDELNYLAHTEFRINTDPFSDSFYSDSYYPNQMLFDLDQSYRQLRLRIQRYLFTAQTQNFFEPRTNGQHIEVSTLWLQKRQNTKQVSDLIRQLEAEIVDLKKLKSLERNNDTQCQLKSIDRDSQDRIQQASQCLFVSKNKKNYCQNEINLFFEMKCLKKMKQDGEIYQQNNVKIPLQKYEKINQFNPQQQKVNIQNINQSIKT